MRRGGGSFEGTSPEELAEDLAATDWACHAAGEGAKGPRLYDWARIRRPWTSEDGFEHWLLVRRKRSKSAERAYYLVFAPPGATLAELAAVAGLRWAIEECFERAKDDLGLDHCEARSWHAWHRYMSLCMAALAFLSKLSADLRRGAWMQTERNESKGANRRLIRMAALIPSVPEIRYLLARLVIFAPTQKPFIIAWSLWRRRHQAAATLSHYKRRLHAQLWY